MEFCDLLKGAQGVTDPRRDRLKLSNLSPKDLVATQWIDCSWQPTACGQLQPSVCWWRAAAPTNFLFLGCWASAAWRWARARRRPSRGFFWRLWAPGRGYSWFMKPLVPRLSLTPPKHSSSPRKAPQSQQLTTTLSVPATLRAHTTGMPYITVSFANIPLC